MKKKMLISTIIVLIISIIIVCILWSKGIIFSKKNDNLIDKNETMVEIISDEELIEKENGKIIDKETNSILFDPKTDYSETIDILGQSLLKGKTPNEYSDTDVVEYLKYFFWIYNERSFEEFSDEEIATIVSTASKLYIPRTEEEVKKVAKAYFNIDNYELPTGTYILKNYGKFTITKIDGYYIKSSVIDRVTNINGAHFKNKIINNNTIEVFYDYAPDGAMYAEGCYSYVKEIQEEGCIIGTYKVHLTYYDEEDRLNIDKIIYEKTE